jgi:Transglycosylase-like domain
MHAERLQESGGNYADVNPNSGAAGAYQFLFTTWQYALRLAGLQGTRYYLVSANEAPASVQDAAAAALMASYFNGYGHSWYNVAEAWYGGPGAVGHPDWGGGPGYPNVGEYANEVMTRFRALGGQGGGGAGPGPQLGSPWSPQWADNLASYYINVIEPVGKTWRSWSRSMPPGFFDLPQGVR